MSDQSPLLKEMVTHLLNIAVAAAHVLAADRVDCRHRIVIVDRGLANAAAAALGREAWRTLQSAEMRELEDAMALAPEWLQVAIREAAAPSPATANT